MLINSWELRIVAQGFEIPTQAIQEFSGTFRYWQHVHKIHERLALRCEPSVANNGTHRFARLPAAWIYLEQGSEAQAEEKSPGAQKLQGSREID